MSEEPSYRDLRERGAREFLTDGPNSGGVAGLLVLGDRVWWFVADWTPWVQHPPMSAEVFLARYGDRDARGYREATAYLRGPG